MTNKVGEITTDENGEGSLVGIAGGTYYLKEVKAPNGYKLLSSAVAVTIDENTTTTTIDIPNTEASSLPFTGGMGTIIYTIIGFVFIIVVSFIYIIYRKKTIKKNEI